MFRNDHRDGFGIVVTDGVEEPDCRLQRAVHCIFEVAIVQKCGNIFGATRDCAWAELAAVFEEQRAKISSFFDAHEAVGADPDFFLHFG